MLKKKRIIFFFCFALLKIFWGLHFIIRQQISISLCIPPFLHTQVTNGKAYFFVICSWENGRSSFRCILNGSKMLLPLVAKCRTSTNSFGQFTLFYLHLFDVFQKHNAMLDQLAVFLQPLSGQDKCHTICSD